MLSSNKSLENIMNTHSREKNYKILGNNHNMKCVGHGKNLEDSFQTNKEKYSPYVNM